MRFNTLEQWLAWQESLHPTTIELGLDRVRTVLERLELHRPAFKIITVAGTNGKGSSVAMLESIYHQASYQIGVYSSPHMLRYNERIRINGEEVVDDALCQAFSRIDQARGDISLTYFEFGTLAAFEIFSQAKLDLVILEVGLGGRLDAVNVLDADVALITALHIDHESWLGKDRETIALEKAGIMRKAKPVVISDLDLPKKVLDYAQQLGAPIHRIGIEFDYEYDDKAVNGQARSWSWHSRHETRSALNFPALRGRYQLQNAAGVMMVLELMSSEFPVNQQNIRQGLAAVTLPGRLQIVPGKVIQIFDVAHNPQAAASLRQSLSDMPCPGKTHAVIAMLHDKDIHGVLQQMSQVVDNWYIADLAVERAEKATKIESILKEIGVGSAVGVECAVTGLDAYECALAQVNEHDRIVVFGSFFLVAEVLQQAL